MEKKKFKKTNGPRTLRNHANFISFGKHNALDFLFYYLVLKKFNFWRHSCKRIDGRWLRGVVYVWERRKWERRRTIARWLTGDILSAGLQYRCGLHSRRLLSYWSLRRCYAVTFLWSHWHIFAVLINLKQDEVFLLKRQIIVIIVMC